MLLLHLQDVFAVIEDVLPPIFAKYGNYDRASGAPFMRIPYLEAMEKYGTDKPDLRIDLTVQDATEVLADCGFGPFATKAEDGSATDVRVKAVVISDFKESRKFIDKTIGDVEVQSGNKAYWFRMDDNTGIRTRLPGLLPELRACLDIHSVIGEKHSKGNLRKIFKLF